MSLPEKLLRNYIRRKLEVNFLKEGYILDDDFMDNSISALFEKLKDYGDNTWLFFDTETTGFGSRVNQLTEIGAISADPSNWQFSEVSVEEGMFYDKIRLTKDTQDRFRSLQKAKDQGEQLDDDDFKFALKLTRYGMKKSEYREQYPKGMPEEIDVVREFVTFIRSQPNPILVAQNAEFDIDFVQGRIDHYGLNEDIRQYPIFDTMILLKLFHNPLIRTMADSEDERAIEILNALTVDGRFGSYVSASMGVVSKAYEINTDEWHNALADVKMMMEMTKRIFQTLQESSDTDITDYQGRAAFGIRKQREKKAARNESIRGVSSRSKRDSKISKLTLTKESLRSIIEEVMQTRIALYLFDFDDTLAITGNVIIVHKPGGETVELDSEEYAEYQKLPPEQKEGDREDYSKFNELVDPQPIEPVLNTLRQALSSPDTHVGIITARGGEQNQLDIAQFLMQQGISIPARDIHTVGGPGGGRPEDKLNVVKDYIDSYDPSEIHFYDDSSRNTDAIISLCAEVYPDLQVNTYGIVDLRVQHLDMCESTSITEVGPWTDKDAQNTAVPPLLGSSQGFKDDSVKVDDVVIVNMEYEGKFRVVVKEILEDVSAESGLEPGPGIVGEVVHDMDHDQPYPFGSGAMMVFPMSQITERINEFE